MEVPCRAICRTLWGACRGWLSYKQCKIMRLGDEVSRRVSGSTMWGVYEEWVSPIGCGVTGRGTILPRMPLVSPCGAPTFDGFSEKGVASRAGKRRITGFGDEVSRHRAEEVCRHASGRSV